MTTVGHYAILNSDDTRSLTGRDARPALEMEKSEKKGWPPIEKLAEKISDAELEVMRVLWEADAPLPISEIRVALQQRKGWEPTTTKTLVQRLCNKHALAQEKRNVFYYRPLISQEEYQAWATNDLIHRLYRGSARNLVAALVHSDQLSNDDIQELRDFFKVEDEP